MQQGVTPAHKFIASIAHNFNQLPEHPQRQQSFPEQHLKEGISLTKDSANPANLTRQEQQFKHTTRKKLKKLTQSMCTKGHAQSRGKATF